MFSEMIEKGWKRKTLTMSWDSQRFENGTEKA